jgi:hydrogenase expression/formation protein HypC
MCLAVVGRITALKNETATADILGVRREISVVLVPDIKIGEYVMIHAGFAINKIDEKEAKRTEKLIREVAEASKKGDRLLFE